MHATCYIYIYNLPCYDYVNNTWWRVTYMKLTTQSSAPLCSYFPLTPNILLTTLLSQTLSVCSSLDMIHQLSHPHKIRWTISVLQISTCNTLNWMAASIVWIYRTLFSKITVLLKLCQDLTYPKPDLQQSDNGTAQAMWHTTQTPRHYTIRTAHNPFSTVELFHEYRFPEKSEFWIFLKCEQHSTERHKFNSGPTVITWSAIGSWSSFSATTETCVILSFKTNQFLFPPWKDVRHYSLQEIPFYRTSR